jgi:hypothetical protein
MRSRRLAWAGSNSASRPSTFRRSRRSLVYAMVATSRTVLRDVPVPSAHAARTPRPSDRSEAPARSRVTRSSTSPGDSFRFSLTSSLTEDGSVVPVWAMTALLVSALSRKPTPFRNTKASRKSPRQDRGRQVVGVGVGSRSWAPGGGHHSARPEGSPGAGQRRPSVQYRSMLSSGRPLVSGTKPATKTMASAAKMA